MLPGDVLKSEPFLNKESPKNIEYRAVKILHV